MDGVYDYLGELEDRCAPFADLTWLVDCEDVPCTLILYQDELEAKGLDFGRAVCGDGLLEMGQTTIFGQSPNRVSIYPLSGIADDAVERLLQERWSVSRKSRLTSGRLQAEYAASR